MLLKIMEVIMKELKKENIENLSYKDIANLIIEQSKKGLNTLELFTKIVELLELPKSTIDSKIGDFYTSMTTDKRFVLLDGLWDLRCRHTSDKVLVKLDEEEEEIEEENLDDDEMVDEIEEDSYDSGDNDDDSFGDTDDLSDLVVIDEEDLDLENN